MKRTVIFVFILLLIKWQGKRVQLVKH
jgi:hypothetical protein